MSIKEMVKDIVATVEAHADYEIPEEGYDLAEFVEWVMDGVGDDLVREGNAREDVEVAAELSYGEVSMRFRP